MVRPSASVENKKLALQFASAVCACEDPDSTVSRTGYCSLFRCLAQACPFAIRGQDPYVGRHGLTEVEFNKVLERNGFTKLRAKKSFKMEGSGHEDSQEDGGELIGGRGQHVRRLTLVVPAVRYVYSGYRWRNPSDPDDRRELVEAWKAIAATSGPFATCCRLEAFLEVCKEYHDGWKSFLCRVPTYPRFFEEVDEALSPTKRKLDEAWSDEPSNAVVTTSMLPRPAKLLHASACPSDVVDQGCCDLASTASETEQGEESSCGEIDFMTEAHLRECLGAYELEGADGVKQEGQLACYGGACRRDWGAGPLPEEESAVMIQSFLESWERVDGAEGREGSLQRVIDEIIVSPLNPEDIEELVGTEGALVELV
ncbi:hypothetical protein GUITHDRAFT_122713 [Guillardia theta CCMP2712]|uniref:Uncharacterized protein n=1 Tax=Guillardia theta (strain CCMP2712) TaxID=905079 RepID=L1I4B2_GUITC|nr:hypothetical protein GUITHDRAFT_122713 [Guillardia theta CCMP2712]EKX31081.1 hypothetical protein GUITHDRAFT_122713 [Guillardia theta CCMP2712]|eukprot:XP_005818061.1 hypothetical protein GUITHDRAFT_122713 [Guillardia theta CCMP2712]